MARLVPLLPQVQLGSGPLGVERKVTLAEGLPGGQVQVQATGRQGRVEAEHALVLVHLQDEDSRVPSRIQCNSTRLLMAAAYAVNRLRSLRDDTQLQRRTTTKWSADWLRH